MSVTIILIIITVLISLRAENNPQLKAKLIMNAYMVKNRKQYYRLLTSGFIHSGMVHLGFNMFTFYWFGEVVEQILGQFFPGILSSIVFVVFYFVSIIISDLPSAIKHGENYGYNSLGASGGVSAVVFCSILFFPLMPLYLMFIPIPIPGFILGTLYIIYSYFQGKNMGDNINHDAHLFGALCGIAFSVLVHPAVLIEFVQQIASYDIGVF